MIQRTIRGLVTVCLAALGAATAPAQQPFAYDGCGVIIDDGCTKLVDDLTGEEYTGDFAPYQVGDHVHVVGWASFSLFFCPPPIDGEFDHGGGFISLIEPCPNPDPTTPFCFGDGSSGACPCANAAAAGEGCANSQGHGAILSGSGSASFAADDLVLHVEQGRPFQPTHLLQGNGQMALPYRDGIYCLASPTVRMEVVILDANGAGSTANSIATDGLVPGPGVTRHYQLWYRDPVIAPCGTGSNFTNAVTVTWM